MSRDFNRGDVDYDYDMYKNRIRKYVVTGFVGKYPNRQTVWCRVPGYCPEKGFNNLDRSIDGSYFSEIPVQNNDEGE